MIGDLRLLFSRKIREQACCLRATMDTMNHMTFAHLLKHVKALPAKERARLLREILVLEEVPAARSAARNASRVTWPDVEMRGKRIVGDRVIPNLVLLERGEENS
jgi:hypothetical protein